MSPAAGTHLSRSAYYYYYYDYYYYYHYYYHYYYYLHSNRSRLLSLAFQLMAVHCTGASRVLRPQGRVPLRIAANSRPTQCIRNYD